MHRIDRILLCLLTTGVCAIAIHLVLPASPAGAGIYSQDSQTAAKASDRNIAVCAIHYIMGELMKSDRFAPAREALFEGVDRTELAQEYNSLVDQMRELREEYERLTQGDQIDPGQAQSELQRIQAEVQRISERMRRIQVKLQPRDQELQQLTYLQYQEAYELVRDAAEAVAEDLGYDYVLATKRRDDEYGRNPASFGADMNARPVLVFPQGVDITLDVISELNLD
jgi:Skp family chaperone for outer membrane proteins